MSIYEEQALTEAANVIGRYVEQESFAPRLVVDLEGIAVSKAKGHPRMDHTSATDLALVMKSVQNVLKERAVGEMTRFDYGRVTLDTDGLWGRNAWRALDIPQIVFCALTSQDATLQTTVAGPVAAMAIYFDPALVGTLPVMDRNTGRPRVDDLGDIMVKPDQFARRGYVGIVRTFPTLEDAEQELNELRQAVSALARPTDEELEDDGAISDIPKGADLTAL